MSLLAAGSASDSAGPMGRPAAIIVDDQRWLAEALAERLGLDGFETTVTTTAAEALESSAKRSYDVAFVDLKLPDMSGVDAAGEMKRRSPALRVILITGLAAFVDDPGVAVGSQIDRVLPKPWKPAELAAILRTVGGSRA